MTANYKHRYISGLTCVKLEPTKKGYKVSERHLKKGRKPKEKVAFYDRDEFDPNHGIWVEILEGNADSDKKIKSKEEFLCEYKRWLIQWKSNNPLSAFSSMQLYNATYSEANCQQLESMRDIYNLTNDDIEQYSEDSPT